MNETETIRINVGNFKVNEAAYPDRCLSASYGGGGVEVDTIPWEGTENKPWDYKYEDGTFILDPIVLPEPIHNPVAPSPSAWDALEAQVLYTALMTDTLIDDE